MKQSLSYPKTRQIAGYSPYFWVRKMLFSAFPESYWGFWGHSILKKLF